MPECGDYRADPSFQLVASAGPTGPVDCTAHAMSDAIDSATCGKKDPSGRAIRLQSSEPVPDKSSPGLNLAQVVAVAEDHYGVKFEVFVGTRALTWAQYEARRKAGQPGIIQVGYGPIADSPEDAFRSRFRGGHAMFETVHATYDPGKDGRSGVPKHDYRVYDRALMRKAAEELVITRGGARAGRDRVWCAFAPDVVPEVVVTIRPAKGHKTRRFATYRVKDGTIRSWKAADTKGFTAKARLRVVPWPSRKKVRYLAYITSGARAGQWVNAKHAKEV